MKKNNRFDLDSYDLKILRILQFDSDTTLQVIGKWSDSLLRPAPGGLVLCAHLEQSAKILQLLIER